MLTLFCNFRRRTGATPAFGLRSVKDWKLCGWCNFYDYRAGLVGRDSGALNSGKLKYGGHQQKKGSDTYALTVQTDAGQLTENFTEFLKHWS